MASKTRRPKKRAIALAGGGPAAGLHIGVLKALEEANIEFDVFSLSCVGAWVGLVYNSRVGPHRAAKTLEFFDEHCFRDDASFEWFPVNRGFAPDIQGLMEAWAGFALSDKRNWDSLVLPGQIGQSLVNTWSLMADPQRWTRQEFNYWMLNDVMAVHPMARYLAALAFRTDIKGMARVYYEDSPVLKDIFDNGLLYEPGMPEIYHNAWKMPGRDGSPGKVQLFHNWRRQSQDGTEHYMRISDRSLCACSALPHILESVTIGEHEYSEGALVDTVSVRNLLNDHPDLDEIWINRIVDNRQVRAASSLSESLANLPMQFAASLGEKDVELFREQLLRRTRRGPRLVEIPFAEDTEVSFDWSRANLIKGVEEGQWATEQILASDRRLAESTV